MSISNMFYNAHPILFERAKNFRANSTEAEKLLWERLSGKQLGFKFRRQHPLDSFVVDFYCHSGKLVIELDGTSHDNDETARKDEERDDILSTYSIRILRFRNDEVFQEIDRSSPD